MKVKQTLKALNVNRIVCLLIILIIMTSCASRRYKDVSLLNTHINKYNLKKDSIFLGLDNSNSEVFKIIRKFNSKSEVIPDELKSVFTKKNYAYFEKQATRENSIWKLDFSILDNVYSIENYPHKNNLEVIYLSKPIYTADGKYALIQRFQKTDEGGYFISFVEVYKKHYKAWKKVSDVSRY